MYPKKGERLFFQSISFVINISQVPAIVIPISGRLNNRLNLKIIL